ncbi:MAG: hypothetical protein ACOX7N_09330 [Lawsonibacter sp.]|jgi:hypothetical protein
MPLKEIGAIFLLLMVIFVFGQLWFHFVESILGWIQSLLPGQKKSSSWHPLPPDFQDKNQRDER